MQLRLANKIIIKFVHKGNQYIVNSELICSVCNKNVLESLFHLYFSCPIYHHLRRQYIKKHFTNGEYNLIQLMNVTDLEKINDIYYYTIYALKLEVLL